MQGIHTMSIDVHSTVLRRLALRATTTALATLLATATLVALVAAISVLSGVALGAEPPEKPAGLPVPTDPRMGEVPLPALGGWNAALVHDNQRVGIWSVKCFPVFDMFACPELVACDDRGRCIVLVSYSGRWEPRPNCHDGMWLGGLAWGDVDPRFAGGEIYTGGLMGNVYQVVRHEHGMLDGRLIAQLPGHEIHTIVAGDLDPTPGREVLLFTKPGGLYRLSPTGPDGKFAVTFLESLPGRIRDAIVLPGRASEPPEIVTAARDGHLRILRLGSKGPVWKTIYKTRMGFGRLAMRPVEAGPPLVLYSTLDDGRVLRHERAGDDWTTTTIYAGPQGPRGVAAGRFHADPKVESIAVYGYSGKVQLLTRGKHEWVVETLFVNTSKGHWLTAAELDGRNATDELVASGFGGRIVLLSRPPGYGLKGVAVEPVPEGEKKPAEEPVFPVPAPADPEARKPTGGEPAKPTGGEPKKPK